MSSIESTLKERGSRYGVFTEHARITQNIKKAMFDSPKFADLTDDQIEALEMIAHKIGRILNGDPNYADSWVDIAGYSKLVADLLETLTETFAPIGEIVPAPESDEAEDFEPFTEKEMERLVELLDGNPDLLNVDFGPVATEPEELRFGDVLKAREDIDQQALNNAYLEPVVRGDVGMAEADSVGEHF